MRFIIRFSGFCLTLKIRLTSERTQAVNTHAGLMASLCFSWIKAPARPPAPEFRYWGKKISHSISQSISHSDSVIVGSRGQLTL